MDRRKLFLAGIALLPLPFVAAVCGSDTTRIENTGDMRTGITVAGQGKLQAPPDVAQISLGVSTLRATVAEAREEAAAAMSAIVDSLKANGVADDDIQTQQLSIYPEYDYRNNESILRGFRVTNTVTAKVREIDNTSKVIDDAVAAGGDNTRLDGIAFTIDDPKELEMQVRGAAVADAREKAEALAQAGGVSVGDPIIISEGEVRVPGPIFYDGEAADRAQAGASTPIEPGELDVVVNVTVTFAIE